MFIVMITSECAPAAKVGGLADVVFGLSRELEIRGNDVEIILPKYDCMRYDHIYALQAAYNDLWVPYYGQWVHCTVYFGFVHGRKCFFIEPHSDRNFFNRGIFYGHHDDPERFAFFCRAALEFMLKSNKHPDIIHCHDWQTGLVPVLLFDIYKYLGMSHPRVCYTLHNMKHQGVTGDFILREVGLDNTGYYMHYDRLRDNFNPHAINLMKGGIVYSNFVTTVSPTYAEEIKYSDQNFGLGHTLHIHAVKFGGVLNGIDYDVWNPEIDRYIPYNYGIGNIEAKYGNKESLRHRLLLRQEFKPIIAYIGRLDSQKGVHLIRHAIFYALERGCQFVLLGSGPDHEINNYFLHLKHQLNDNPDCHLEIGYNEELAHLIYAGADMIIVPSLFEPCGLTQMIAMKYGTVPIVRHTGGLADTVFDADYAHKPYHERNGYVFHHFNYEGLESAMSRAIGMWYSYPQYFRELMINGMRYDYSWKNPGGHYLNIYEYIRDKN
ncbi:MAG: glycogen synthase [Deferribacteres bacterium]|nr:glycogen synthase [Deferribacteres bacterium]